MRPIAATVEAVDELDPHLDDGTLLSRLVDMGDRVRARVLGGVFFFYVIWGFIWYGIKTLLLKHFVHFSKEERRQAFSSRMKEPFA